MTQPEVYVPLPHVVRPHEVLAYVYGGNLEKGVNLKTYTLVPEGERDFDSDERKAVNDRILDKISRGNIYVDAKLWPGIGFSILSDSMVNVCTWGGKFPSLLNQAVYSFKREDLLKEDSFKPESLSEVGTFCCYEGAVVGHESLAWRRFLFSAQSIRDREAYLEDRLEGIVR